MPQAAEQISARWQPRIIKISRKRQITIPSEVYEKAGFSEYALASWTENGLVLQPVDVKDENSTVRILRMLLAQGLDGEELINEYERIEKSLSDLEVLVDEGIGDIEKGRVSPFEETQRKLKAKYGL